MYAVILITLLSYFSSYLSSTYLLGDLLRHSARSPGERLLQYELRAKPSAHLMSSSLSINPRRPSPT